MQVSWAPDSMILPALEKLTDCCGDWTSFFSHAELYHQQMAVKGLHSSLREDSRMGSYSYSEYT